MKIHLLHMCDNMNSAGLKDLNRNGPIT